MIRQQSCRTAAKTFTRLALVALAISCAVAAFVTRGGRAATPAGGTLTLANTPTNPLTFTGGPYAVGNPSNFVSLVCANPAAPCDDYALDVDVPDGLRDTKQVRVRLGWANTAADIDLAIYQRNADGTAGALATRAGTSSDPEIALLPAVKGKYVVRVIPFAPLNETATVAITVEPKASSFVQAAGAAPQYRNYPAPADIGGDSGEPSLGVNWKTGNVMFIAHFLTLRAVFDDTKSPATAAWSDVSAINTSITTTDPILWTDSVTGRTIVSQLTGPNSLSAFTDDDGETWIPTEGGPLTSGVDHQTVGGGPFAAPIPQGVNPVYPHAVYYCSQDLVTAFCARSDDGGVTFGPTIPMFLQTCGGIHGHVKVAPDGTVYVPNRSCGSNQGLLVSVDNGITWDVRPIADTDPSTSTYDSISDHWDPSVGVGSAGTIYFGYDNGDGTAHVAVSHDRGHTWVNDQNVGKPFGVKDTAFPAVVAGDDDRAAFAFLGSQVESGSDAAEWHLYVATTYDGGNSWHTVDATPTDPVQRGTICFEGFGVGACPKGDRNLLDFMDATVDKLGRVLVGYADGCVGCSSPGGSRSKLATIARQTCGRRLFKQYDPATDDCAAATPTPSPTATPTPSPTPTPGDDPRCKPAGVEVVSDAAGDQTGAPNANQQADIKSISISEQYPATGAQLVVKMKLAQLNPTLLPPNTFWQVNFNATHADGSVTTYFVNAATNSNSNPAGIAYRYGFLDNASTPPTQLSDGTADAGSLDAANATITITLKMDKLRKPVPPNTSAGETRSTLTGAQVDLSAGRKLEAVNGETSLLVGAGGTGLGETIDDTSNGEYTMAGAAACPAATPTPSPTPSGDPASCNAPGTQIVADAAGDQTGAPAANQHLDILSVSVAEPVAFDGAGQRVNKLTFTMKVSSLPSLQPNSIYRNEFVYKGTTYHVSLVTDANANPSYNYGRITTGVGTDGAADAGSFDASKGTITITVSNNKIGNPQPGETLTGAFGDARLNAGGAVFAPIDSTSTTSYTLVGSAVCAVTATPTPTPTPAVATNAPRYLNYAAPPGIAESAGEPSIGVNWRSERTFSNSNGATPNGGTVTYFGGFLPYMLTAVFDDSVSPANVVWDQAPLVVANAPRVFGDPILFTDHQTGRTFVSQELGLSPLGSTMEWTDDDGRSFRPSTGSGAPSGIDHQTVGGGPYHQPLNIVTNPVYPNSVYYCSQALEYANCSLSVDGGTTFGPAVPMYTALDCGGIHGHVKVGPDGTVYVPNRDCGGQQGLAVSQDNGITWKVSRVTGSTAGDTDPSVGVGADGNTVYFGYEGGDGHARIAVSHDKGQTWGVSTDVGAPAGVQNSIFPAVVAGDANRAAFAFHGSATGGAYNNDSFTGTWYLYVATTTDGGQTWTTVNATPGDPVQRGRVCTDGINCTGTTRNLLDFFDATVDKEGRVLVGYVDGCLGSCVQSGPNTGSAKAVIARQSGGSRMFAQYDPPEFGVAGAPAVGGGLSGATANLAWQTPDNGGSPITGYKVYRRDGALVTPLATVTANSFSDPGYSAAAQSVYRVTALNAKGESAYKEFNPALAVPPPTACVQPGILVVRDVNNEGADLDGNQNTPPDPRVNIKNLYIAEPYMGAGTSKLVFTLKVAPSTLPIAPPSSQWFIIWNRPVPDKDFDRWYVAMKTDAAGTPSFEYGRFGVPLNTSTATLPPPENPNANQSFKLGNADGGSYDAATGTITITLSTSKAEGIGAGFTMKGVNARTFFARPDAGFRSQNVASDITGDGTYQLVGNNSCASAALTPTPEQRQGAAVQVAWAGVPAALTRWAVGLSF